VSQSTANLYQLYERNGLKCPFRVSRSSWGGTVATVKSIGGQTSGPLKGRGPYWGNPVVVADVVGTWTESDAILPCCGSYQWSIVK
jgi:hypothetical protein